MKWFGMLWQSLLSVVKIVLQSKLVTRLPGHFSNPDELLILANGPSLKRTVEESADFVRGKTLLAVNFCVTSPMFEQLKPELYLIADPLFWIVPEKRRAAVSHDGREDHLGHELLGAGTCAEEQGVATAAGGQSAHQALHLQHDAH